MSKTLMTIGTGILVESYRQLKEIIDEKFYGCRGNIIGSNIENDHYQWNTYDGVLVAEAVELPDNELSKQFDVEENIDENKTIYHSTTKPWRLWIKGVNA